MFWIDFDSGLTTAHTDGPVRSVATVTRVRWAPLRTLPSIGATGIVGRVGTDVTIGVSFGMTSVSGPGGMEAGVPEFPENG